MDEPYRDFARLVGKVLATRWLNKRAKQSQRSETQINQLESTSADIDATGDSESDTTERQ